MSKDKTTPRVDGWGIRCDDGQFITSYTMRCSSAKGTSLNLTFGPASRAAVFGSPDMVRERIASLRAHAPSDYDKQVDAMTAAALVLKIQGEGGRSVLCEVHP